ncbi:complement resistance protein TraT [Vibrio sp. McD22-P3]|uniref:complement resistance protein TraT n=1 Tax=Vibrio sp. McD22-P3 TaxID=2724880 RepID=UPI001F33D7DA|nr:complement resistance protein TraT [Vibrio sp. McD22-P3]MCF4176741.1 complement resistance protein TraT [Vibrio sp. McD22-P3]
MIKKVIIISMLSLLAGCSATQTAMTKQDLSIESKVSNPVVLEPLAPEERIVYIRVKDLTGNSMRKEMTRSIRSSLALEGVTVTNNPKEANLMLSAFVMSAQKTTKDEMNAMVNSGYKGAAEGALTAGAITAIAGGSGRTTAGVALVGAAVGFLADTLIEDSYYTFVLDVELRERPLVGDEITNKKSTVNAGGFSGTNNASVTVGKSSVNRGKNYNWITYQTRIITVANKMNLNIEEAIPKVQEKTSDTLSEFLL